MNPLSRAGYANLASLLGRLAAAGERTTFLLPDLIDPEARPRLLASSRAGATPARAFAAILTSALLAAPAFARDDGQWDLVDPHVRQWFQGLMQPDNPTASCCGEADAVEADTFSEKDGHYVAVVTDGKGILAPGTRILIPDAKIKWDKGNPTGHGIVFLHVVGEDEEDPAGPAGSIHVYCYVTPGGV